MIKLLQFLEFVVVLSYAYGFINPLTCCSDSRCSCIPLKNYKYKAACVKLGLTKSTFPRFYNNVTHIDLSGNKIKQMPFPIHMFLPKSLNFLNLSNNELRSLDNNSLKGLKNLKSLSVNSNSLYRIHRGTFVSLSSLQVLDVSANKWLNFRVFANISYDLQFTDIKSLNMGSIHCGTGMSTTVIFLEDIKDLSNTSIREIILTNNRLGSFQKGALSLLPKTLRHVNISYNNLFLEEYVFEIPHMTGLEVLDAGKRVISNSMSYGCYDWRGPPSKTVLTGSGFNNSFTLTFPIPPNLKDMRLNNVEFGNQIGHVKFALNNNLRKLQIQRNHIYRWIGPVENLHQLEYADFSNNMCYYISPLFFQDFPNLTTLNIHNNPIGRILAADKNGSIFFHLTSLKKMHVSNNAIYMLPLHIFGTLTSLEMLDVSFNYLTEWTPSIRHMKHLKFLNLASNRLSYFDDHSITEIEIILRSSKLTISLQDNVLQCTCDTLHFLKWMKMNSEIFLNFDSYKCVDTQNRVISFIDIDLHLRKLTKNCTQHTGLIFGVLIAIVISIAAVAGGIIYRYRWRLRYIYYMTKRRLKRTEQLGTHCYENDAFISYADEDANFALESLREKLEGHYKLKLLFHTRDFLPGKPIQENISDAVHKSRKTVILLSPNFLKSHWCMFEFNMAHMESVYSRNGDNIIVVVRLSPIRSRDVPLQMMTLMEQETYIDYPNNEEQHEDFWLSLNRAIRM